jgi:hypothetical protein
MEGGIMINHSELVASRVHEYYWEYDWNCATTVLRILAEIDGIELNEQVLAAAVGMHGAGRYGAQCGLVEGGLMYLGIRYYEELGPGAVEKLCYRLAEQYEDRFGSLLCRELRPEGFHPDNPPHLCEKLTVDSILFLLDFLSRVAEPGAG